MSGADEKAFDCETGKPHLGGLVVVSISGAQAYTRGLFLPPQPKHQTGFRGLYYNYDSDGYLYKVWTYGPQITVGVQF